VYRTYTEKNDFAKSDKGDEKENRAGHLKHPSENRSGLRGERSQVSIAIVNCTMSK